MAKTITLRKIKESNPDASVEDLLIILENGDILSYETDKRFVCVNIKKLKNGKYSLRTSTSSPKTKPRYIELEHINFHLKNLLNNDN